MPELLDVAYFTRAPDWVCEVLSPSTALRDRSLKMKIYARERVAHVWLIDPRARTLEVFRYDGDGYHLVDVFGEDQVVRAEPFAAVGIELGHLWLGHAKG